MGARASLHPEARSGRVLLVADVAAVEVPGLVEADKVPVVLVAFSHDRDAHTRLRLASPEPRSMHGLSLTGQNYGVRAELGFERRGRREIARFDYDLKHASVDSKPR